MFPSVESTAVIGRLKEDDGMIRTLITSRAGKAESKVPSIILLIFIAIAIFLGYKFIPIYLDHVHFENDVKKALNWDRFSEGHIKPTPDRVREKVLHAARANDIPLNEKLLDVREQDGFIVVDSNYTQKIRLPIYGEYQWKFLVHMVQAK